MSKKASKPRKTKKKSSKNTEETVEKTFNLHTNVASYISQRAKAENKTEEQVVMETFTDGVLVLMTEETLGKSVVQLKYIDPWGSGAVETLQAVGEDRKEPEANLKIFKDLREEFAPVSAGIEWYKAFTSGGGFNVMIDDPDDEFKKTVKEDIKDLCKDIFQDTYNIGLDHILDILLDDTFTVGCAAAEIVYKNWGKKGMATFEDFAERDDSMVDEKKVTKWDILEPKWKKLGGVVQLKIIDDAYSRLKPYRDPTTYQVLFWTLDEEKSGSTKKTATKKQKEPKRLHTWQVLWLAWNTRGTQLYGKSVIKPVANVALLLKSMQTSIGESFRRWSNRKYFFVTGTEKRPWAKPHIANFMKDIKKMVTDNKTAIPVPAGFDVKDIGGEIFEGRNVLDHFTSMITGGMQYPRDFLEFGRTRAGDKAWLAWLVRYGRNQLQLRRAVEQQLWRRHLWCMHGKTRRIPKKGVKKRKQEKVAIYVPKMEWRAEGKWHRETKLKMLSGVMNWANPADPPLKMGVQSDIATTLGYGEINFKQYIELMELRTKISLINAQRDLAKVEQLQKQEDEMIKAGVPVVEAPTEEKTKEDELKERAKKRGDEGVSKAIKPTDKPNKKGVAKTQGGTRFPAEESLETGELVYDRRIYDERLKTEKLKQEKIILEQKLLRRKEKVLAKLEASEVD